MALRYEETGRLKRGLRGGVSAIAFSHDGIYLAVSGMQDVKVYIWRVADNKLLHTYSGSELPVLSLEWLPGRTDTVLCGSKGGYIAMLRFNASISEVEGFWAHNFPVERLAAKDHQLISGAHSEVKIWKYSRNGEWKHVGDLQGPSADSKNVEEEMIVMGIHWTKTEIHASVVIITYMHHGIVMYNSYDWTRLRSIPLSDIGGSSVSPRGSLIALSVMGFGFDLYDLNTGDCIASFQDQCSGGSTVGTATLWNVPHKRVHQTLSPKPYNTILAITAYHSPDLANFTIATGASDVDGDSVVSVWMAKDSVTRSASRRPSPAVMFYILAALVALGLIAMKKLSPRDL